MQSVGPESLTFCSRQISKACTKALDLGADVPAVLAGAQVILRYQSIRDLHIDMAQVFRHPQKVWDVLTASATEIRREANLRKAVLRNFQMSPASRAAFRVSVQPIIFCALYLEQEVDYFWFDQPQEMTIDSCVPLAQTFPQKLVDNIALMGSDFLDRLVNYSPDQIYINIDVTPQRMFSWLKLWEMNVGHKFSRICIQEMAAAMRRVPATKAEMDSVRSAAEDPPKGSYLFKMDFCQCVYVWGIMQCQIDDTSSPDLTNTIFQQGKPFCCKDEDHQTDLTTHVLAEYDLKKCSHPDCNITKDLQKCLSCGMPYCGQIHQRHDWKSHKTICALYAENKSRLDRSAAFTSKFTIFRHNDGHLVIKET